MKAFFKVLLCFFFFTFANAQIGGISGSKLSAVSVGVVGHHKLEFEPGFAFCYQSKYWNGDNELADLYANDDSVRVVSEKYFRFTYGLFDQMEIGLAAPTNMSAISFGMRYIVFEKGPYGFALMAGYNAPLGNEVRSTESPTEENTGQAGLGIVGSVALSEKFSVDVNLQHLRFLERPQSLHDGATFFNVDAGYYFLDHALQAVTGLGYQHHGYSGGDSFLLTAYPGVTIETGSNYIIVLAAPVDLYGKNAVRSLSFNFALTVTLN